MTTANISTIRRNFLRFVYTYLLPVLRKQPGQVPKGSRGCAEPAFPAVMDALPFCLPEHQLRICYFAVAFRIL